MGPRQLLPLFLAIGLSAAASPVVRNPRPLPRHWTDNGPQQIHTGNFGGDSASDILTVTGGSIQVLINEATGIFGTPVLSPITEGGYVESAAGDLDADGDLDLALSVHENFASQLVVYLNNGSGVFTRGAVIGNARLGKVAIGDFTGDGRADIAVASRQDIQGSREAAIFAGNGAGAFAAPVITALSDDPDIMRVVNANGDGRADLILGGFAGVTIALGQSNGTLSAARVPNPAGSLFSSVFKLATGDFNADGNADFAALGNDQARYAILRVFLGAGNATFTVAGDSLDARYESVGVADMDADGRPDLLAAGAGGSFGVMRGNGNGTFGKPQFWHSSRGWSIAGGDYNRDAVADVVMLDNTAGTSLQFIAGTGPGTFDTYRTWPARDTASGTSQTTAADMNNDGAPDVVTLVAADELSPASISVMLNAKDGNATMLPPVLTPTTATTNDGPGMAIGDIDRDGRKDILVVSGAGFNPTARVFLGRNDGTFHALSAFPIPQWTYGPWLADMTGDGVLDFILRHSSGMSSLYRGTTSNTFVDPLLLDFRVDAIGDVNGDGRADLVSHPSRDTIVAINSGNGTAFSKTIYPDGDYAGIGALEDIDGDGHLDLLMIAHYGTILRSGHGDGTFGAPRSFAIRPGIVESFFEPYSVRTGDLDGDGKRDIVSGTRFWLGRGDGTWDHFARVVGEFGMFGVADFDGNGTDDVAIAGGGAAVSIIRTNLGPDPTLTPVVGLTADKANPRYAEQVTYLATVTGAPIPPTGAVVFARNGVPFEMRELDSLTPGATTAHPVGPITVTATYTGDDQFHAAAAPPVQHTVAKAATTLVVPSPSISTACGQEVAVQVILHATQGWGLPGPTPAYAFREGATPLQVRPYPGVQGYYLIAGLGMGPHTINAEFTGDANYLPSSTTFSANIVQSINATISAGSGVFANDTGEASVLNLSGATFNWTVTNGSIASGQGTAKIVYSAGASGEVALGVTITREQCSNSSTRTVPILPRAPGASMLYLVTPCRALDTRGAPLSEAGTHELALQGVCGIPADAASVVVNLTVVSPSEGGWLALFASDVPWAGTSTLNYRAGQTRANNAIVRLGSGARLSVIRSGPPVHYLIDVVGYFR